MSEAAPTSPLAPATRALLSRYTLAPRVMNTSAGERLTREAGGSLEFFDTRPYGVGDELRYVDWKAYARTGRLFTRLFQAERSAALRVLLDTSPSMGVGGKFGAAQRIAALLVFASLGMPTQVERFGGLRSPRGGGRRELPQLWRFIGETPEPAAETPVAALQAFAARSPYAAGTVVVVSDLFDPAPLTPALVALRARRLDVCFVQVMAPGDLEPRPGRLELRDSETGERLEVGPDEVRRYREAALGFLARTRAAVLEAGFRYALLRAPELGGGEDAGAAGDAALTEGLYRAGILTRR